MADPVDIEYDELGRETDAAILFVLEEGFGAEGMRDFRADKTAWIPRSQIVEHDEDNKVVTVTEWFASMKGLI